jgi:cytochrome c biogenesis protein CcdA
MADVGGAAIAVLGLYAIIFVGPVVLVAVAIARIVKNRREEKIKRLG